MNADRDPVINAITSALAAPFELREVKWKAQAVKGNSALAVAFVDARVIQDRLDDVLGVAGWQDTYELVPDGSVMCKLKCKFGDRWITKMDVGSPSEQPDGGDRLKAAFSDALKRAAVKFGVARYLYRLPMQWTDYDPTKKKFTTMPKMPAFGMPKTQPAPAKPQASSEKPVVLCTKLQHGAIKTLAATLKTDLSDPNTLSRINKLCQSSIQSADQIPKLSMEQAGKLIAQMEAAAKAKPAANKKDDHPQPEGSCTKPQRDQIMQLIVDLGWAIGHPDTLTDINTIADAELSSITRLIDLSFEQAAVVIGDLQVRLEGERGTMNDWNEAKETTAAIHN